jgi:hypothetical protein
MGNGKSGRKTLDEGESRILSEQALRGFTAAMLVTILTYFVGSLVVEICSGAIAKDVYDNKGASPFLIRFVL